MDEKCCASCRFFHSMKDFDSFSHHQGGVCKLNPPLPTSDREWEWPEVAEIDYCFKYEPNAHEVLGLDQPVYREPTNEDIGNEIYVRDHMAEFWRKRILVGIDDDGTSGRYRCTRPNSDAEYGWYSAKIERLPEDSVEEEDE